MSSLVFISRAIASGTVLCVLRVCAVLVLCLSVRGRCERRVFESVGGRGMPAGGGVDVNDLEAFSRNSEGKPSNCWGADRQAA